MVLTATKERIPLAALVLALGAAVAVLVVMLRPGVAPERDAARTPGPAIERVPVVLAAPTDEESGAPDDSAAALAPVLDDAFDPSSASQPQSSPLRGPEGEPERSPRRSSLPTGSVRGRLMPRLEGVPVFVGGAGVLPLDSEAVAWPVEPDGEVPAPVQWVTTGPDGRFLVEGLESGPLRLLVRTEGHARLERDDLWVLAGDDLDLGDLVLDPASGTRVIVTDSGGRVVEGSRLYLVPQRFSGPVRALGPAACSILGRGDSRGRFEAVALPFGASRLLAVAPGHPPAWKEVVLERGRAPDNITIQLPPSSAVFGELIDVDDLGLAGLRVGALSLRAPRVTFEQARAAGVPGEALAAWRTTRADDERRFILEGLDLDETVLLRALGQDRMDVPDAFAPDVLATAPQGEVELFRRAGAELAFQAVDDRTGEPVAPVRARLTSRSGGRPARLDLREQLFPGSRVLWKDIRPRYAAFESLFADLPESADTNLVVRSGGLVGLAGRSLRLRTGERIDLGTIRLQPTLPPLEVLVADDEGGQRLAGAECELVPVSASGRSMVPLVLRGDTDARGRARVQPRGNLTYDLVVRREGYAPRRIPAVAAPADGLLLVEMRPGGTLRVHVLDAERKPIRAEVLRRKAGAEVVSSLVEEYERKLTDADGVAEFTNLEPGMVSVAARSLPRHDLGLPADPKRMTWVATSVASGSVAEIEAPAGPILRLEVRPEADGARLPHALVRLAPDPTAFSDPYADASTLATWPTARCDADGMAVFEGLPAADYALRVEHPELSGFGRCVVRLEPGSQSQWVEVRAGGVAGWVLDEADGVFAEAVVVAWALGPIWEEPREIELWTSLEEIAPTPITLGAAWRGEDGSFGLTGPRGVQTVLTGLDAEGGYVGDYWLAELPEAGEGEPIGLYTAPGARLDVVVVASADGRPPSLGVVAVCLDQPWGRGIIAQPLEANRLELDHVPQGRWKLCAVELASEHLIVGIGPWVEVEALPQDEPLFLPWRE